MKYQAFLSPDNYYRPAPFWAINDRVTPEETARQMADMMAVGLSGGFFHSRHGLITDYLSDEWFAAMEAALQVAKEQDGYLWLYDEDLWPSGNAGGQVAGMKDEYRQAYLRAEFYAAGEAVAEDAEAEVKAVYRLSRDGMRLTGVEAISYADACAQTDTERLVVRRRYSAKTAWWSGESYSNLLHPEVTKEFIKLTHERYRAVFGAEFGKRVPGIFTDEPQVAVWGDGGAALPWYEGYPEVYAAWTGRDFWADLPYLYFNGAEDRKVRLLIHRCILRQFCAAYSKPIFDWCEQFGIAHTGHYNAEDSFAGQISNHGGSIMAHYRYQQIPGIDHLCRQTEPMLLTVKQTSSAARQLGRKQVLTEIFGVSRHTNTFADFKWLGDYDLVLGATFFCPHLTLYSARGRRKRDYPPNWNYQQTYWHELKPLNDYFTRVGYALTMGEAQVDVLLLHSIESATAARRLGVKTSRNLPGEDLSAAHDYDAHFRLSLEAILNAGFECDLGDEWYLEEMGSVEGDTLRIGAMTYRVVVVPPSSTWRPSTFALLSEFAANGGQLIFLGELPREVDCEASPDAWRRLAARGMIVPCATEQIQQAVAKVAPKRFALRTPDGGFATKTYVQHRAEEGQQTFFIVNSDRTRAQEYIFTLYDGAATPLAVWNPLDGTRTQAAAQPVGADLRYRITLPPTGSLLLIAGVGAVDDAVPEALLPELACAATAPLPATWAFTRAEENVLVLDRLSASVDGGQTWWPEDLEFRIRRKLAAHFQVENALQWQPWVAIRKGLGEGKGGPVTLRYRFCSAIAPQRAYLVMEDLAKGTVAVNGTLLEVSADGWQWDQGFGKVEITALVQPGENVVEYTTDYNFLTEVESAFIVGDFGVRLASPYAGEIIDEPAQLANGSWQEQGYPFYSGAMTYQTTISVPAGQRVFLRLANASGILYQVSVNGQPAGSILWPPHLLELTGALRDGENTLAITVIASRQNTLGPLHEKDGDDNLWCGPNAFEDEHLLREELSLFDYGLLGGAELVCLPVAVCEELAVRGS